MGMSESAVHINNLIALKDFCNNNGVFTLTSNIEQSLNYAISSLKTDLKYDLLYEGEKIYTKADMVAMLTEIQLEIEEKFNDRPFSYNHHQRTKFYCDIDEIIQQKINALEERKDA